MNVNRLKPAKLFIWDLDNVVYRYTPEFYDACHQAAARAAIFHVFAQPLENAVQCAKQSYAKYGRSIESFFREHGIAERDIFTRYHDELDSDFIKPDHRMNLGFQQSGVTHALLTHGSSDWANRVLQARAIKHHFKPEHIVSVDQIDFAMKHDGPRAFEHVLKLTGHQAQDAVMIEDTAKNLEHPKAMGMQTVHVSYGNPSRDAFIDHSFDTAQHFLASYRRQIGRISGRNR